MSNKLRTRHLFFLPCLSILWLTLFAPAGVTTAEEATAEEATAEEATAEEATAEEATLCASTDTLPGNSVWRGSGSLPGHPEVWRLDLSEPGLLTLDVSSPGHALVEPLLTVLGSCPRHALRATPRSRDFRLLLESPTSLVLEIEAAGSILIAVSSQDPSQPLADYKLGNAFVVGASSNASSRDVEEDEDDILLSQIKAPGNLPGYPADGMDDHADTPLCASPLRLDRPARGKVENAFGDDEDYFTFVLEAQETIEMTVGEGVGIHAVLYDASMQRLTSWEDQSDLGARIVRTLHPGRYYVRVEGRVGSEETYVLRVARLDPFRF